MFFFLFVSMFFLFPFRIKYPAFTESPIGTETPAAAAAGGRCRLRRSHWQQSPRCWAWYIGRIRRSKWRSVIVNVSGCFGCHWNVWNGSGCGHRIQRSLDSLNEKYSSSKTNYFFLVDWFMRKEPSGCSILFLMICVRLKQTETYFY